MAFFKNMMRWKWVVIFEAPILQNR